MVLLRQSVPLPIFFHVALDIGGAPKGAANAEHWTRKEPLKP